MWTRQGVTDCRPTAGERARALTLGYRAHENVTGIQLSTTDHHPQRRQRFIERYTGPLLNIGRIETPRALVSGVPDHIFDSI
jgi:hypothetical protein